jgi:hypothetical protein
MKKMISVIAMVFMMPLSAHAGNKYDGADYFNGEIKSAAYTPDATPVPAQQESDAVKKLEAIRNQEQWVEKLQKQLAGETSQLGEMRNSLAQSYGLDIKKLEKSRYHFDAKSGKIVEK